MSTRAFLDRLFGGCDDGVVELRALPSKQRCWARVGDWSTFGPFVTAQVRAGNNVYVGIATRRDTSAGTGENLHTLPALFVDIDVSPAEVRARLATFAFRPTLFVASGYGAQLCFVLREPLDLTDVGELARAASLLRRLCGQLQGDDRATDPARILRLPGTKNFKYGEPRAVELLDVTDAVVDVSELDELLPRDGVGDYAGRAERRAVFDDPCAARSWVAAGRGRGDHRAAQRRAVRPAVTAGRTPQAPAPRADAAGSTGLRAAGQTGDPSEPQSQRGTGTPRQPG